MVTRFFLQVMAVKLLGVSGFEGNGGRSVLTSALRLVKALTLILGLVAIALIAIVARRKTVVRLGPSAGFVQERATVCDNSLAPMSPNIEP